jgi:ATP-dependent protease ClpP protease subunit
MRKLASLVLPLFLLGASKPLPVIQPKTPNSDLFVMELNGEINDDSIAPLVKKIDELSVDYRKYQEDKSEDSDHKVYKGIWLKINSPGGSVMSGDVLIEKLQNAPFPTTCSVNSISASMAAFLFESNACSTRVGTVASVLMYHEAGVGVSGGQHPQDLRNALQTANVLTDAMLARMSERTGIKFEDLKAKVDGKEWWVGFKEAQKFPLYDMVVKESEIPPTVEPLVKEDENFLQKLLGGKLTSSPQK